MSAVELLFLIVGVAYAGALITMGLVWQFKPLPEERAETRD